MAFELVPCRVHAGSGELLARGVVREHTEHRLVVEAKSFSGSWLHPGDPAVLDLLTADRGTLTYDAMVEFAVAGRIALTDLLLREVVQQRSALRVPTTIPVQVTPVVAGTEEIERFPAVVTDLSALGLRLNSATGMDVGARFSVLLTVTRVEVTLTAEVLRRETVRGGFSHGCRLVGASERVHDELFRFVLHEQRRQLARQAGGR